MSQQDNFSSGFLWGAALGGIAGGLVGAVLANQLGEPDRDRDDGGNDSDEQTTQPELSPVKSRRRPLRIESAPKNKMELARQSLEDKIASLNDAIDDVRQQLHQVNAEDDRSSGLGRDDRSIAKPTGDRPSGETS